MRFFFSGLGGVLGATGRIEIYETLELLLSNQVALGTALSEIYRVESRDGKKKNEINAVVLYECQEALKAGRSLSDALESWIPEQENQLIRAGERSGRLAATLLDAKGVIEAKRQIVGAVIGGSLYPIVLMVMIGILLYQIANKMVPEFEQLLPADQWTGPALMLKFIADFVTGYGLYSIAAVGLFATWVAWSLPNLHRSRLRIVLDRIPPWSIYRMLHGSTFLLNISVMMRAGIGLQDILISMGRNASPWLSSRLKGAVQGLALGFNLGEALHNTGNQFPDPRAVQFLRVLAQQRGFEDRLSNFGGRWLKKSVEGIQGASKLMLVLGILFAGGLMLFILAGVVSIQQLAQTAITATH